MEAAGTFAGLKPILYKSEFKMEDLMIARLWHGITSAGKADEYLEYLQKTGIQDYRATQGNLSVQLLRRIEGEQAHFLIITLWESVDAIKKFAGEEYELARYYPEDQNFLLAFEEKVVHYEVMSSRP
jgi:heme-degrading monooxygenase HmoA